MMKRLLMRLFGITDRYREGFLRGRYYALGVFSDAMMHAKVPIDTQIQIHKFMVAVEAEDASKVDFR